MEPTASRGDFIIGGREPRPVTLADLQLIKDERQRQEDQLTQELASKRTGAPVIHSLYELGYDEL